MLSYASYRSESFAGRQVQFPVEPGSDQNNRCRLPFNLNVQLQIRREIDNVVGPENRLDLAQFLFRNKFVDDTVPLLDTVKIT